MDTWLCEFLDNIDSHLDRVPEIRNYREYADYVEEGWWLAENLPADAPLEEGARAWAVAFRLTEYDLVHPEMAGWSATH